MSSGVRLLQGWIAVVERSIRGGARPTVALRNNRLIAQASAEFATLRHHNLSIRIESIEVSRPFASARRSIAG
jgi:hypothetical protein